VSFDFVIDSYAWIEYYRGSQAGRRASSYIEANRAATSTLTIAELHEKYLKEKWSFFEEDLKYITTRTSIVAVDRSIALLAGEINYERKKIKKGWGMADSLVLATARNASAKVVTGDRHFEDLPETIMI